MYCIYMYLVGIYTVHQIHKIYPIHMYYIHCETKSEKKHIFLVGKKWNILRRRVDSVEHDIDRLFIGTLLFTILLFLLPTVFLYYIVFTSLRLLIILMQAVLFGFVALFNSFPFWGLWIYFMNPEYLPGTVHVELQYVLFFLISRRGNVSTYKLHS